MLSTPLLLHSQPTPFHFPNANSKKPSFRPFIKQLVCSSKNNTSIAQTSHESFKDTTFQSALLKCMLRNRTRHGFELNCAYISVSNISESNFDKTPVSRSVESFKNVREVLTSAVMGLTPLNVYKWGLVACGVIATIKWVLGIVLSPFFWMYFSWTWMFWPWFIAVGLAGYGGYCFNKHRNGQASGFEQLAIVTSVFTWMILVPPAYFNGFLEGWPYVFFFMYHYFFFFNVSVRKRMYGDYYVREHDEKWDVALPMPMRVLFGIGVIVGHWFAAMEGPELQLIPGGWINIGIWVSIFVTLFLQYHSTLYLAKYSEKVVVPTAVVQFGPYRWVRHPIYASVILLFATYFVALRAPFSLIYLVAVCVAYYNQKAKLEEALMLETFGEGYKEYMNKVRYKFIPYIY